jgi:4-amino-4-deoxy-L-arabinose transferase-like glycosyltransferase
MPAETVINSSPRGVMPPAVTDAAASALGSVKYAKAALIVSLVLLASALRLASSVAFEDGRWLVTTCGDPWLDQIKPIVNTGNPLRIEVFWYPPVPTFMVSAVVGLWIAVFGRIDIGVGCTAVTNIVSLATVGVVYLLGSLWGVRHGLIAMALYSVTMIAVVVQTNPQVYSTFFAALALYAMLRADRSGRLTPLIIGGGALGLAVASKYTPIFLAGMLFIPFLHRYLTPRRDVDGAIAACDTRWHRALTRVWPIALSTVIVVSAIVLYLGVAHRPSVYELLRALYAQRPHENPFEFHAMWIGRLYRLTLSGTAGVALVCTLALVIPWSRHVRAWEGMRRLYVGHRMWIIPVAAFGAAITVFSVVPAMLNIHDFARSLVGLLKMHSEGDYGMFPAGRPAASFLFAFIPENTGLPLFLAGVIGLVYGVVSRDARVLWILVSVLPAYVVAEFARVKVNRYVLELMPVWCVLTATWLAAMVGARKRSWRLVGAGIVVAIVCYSTIYSLAWAQVYNPRGDVRDQTAAWVNASIPAGTTLGITSGLILANTPELLPERESLTRYSLVNYADEPDYVLLPNSIHAVVTQYLELRRKGYVYTQADWGGTSPSANDLAVVSRIVREDGYTFVNEFAKRPRILGIEVRSASLTGRTWMIEHNPAAGIRMYRRTSRPNVTAGP